MIATRRWIVPVAAVVVIVVVVVLYVGFAGQSGPNGVTRPKVTIDFVRSREDPILNGYGWVDQKNGIARIPVARAIDLVAAKGLPSRPVAGGTPTPADKAQSIPSYSSSGTLPEPPLNVFKMVDTRRVPSR